jgi:hypothetical protein
MEHSVTHISSRSDIAKQWCQLNKITTILRSHEVRNDGFQEEHDVSEVQISWKRDEALTSKCVSPGLHRHYLQCEQLRRSSG